MDRVFVEEAWKEQPQQIDRDRGDRRFGWQILSVELIDSAHFGVAHQQLIGELRNRLAHGEHYPAAVCTWQGEMPSPQHTYHHHPPLPGVRGRLDCEPPQRFAT